MPVMFIEAADDETSTVLWLFTGATNSDEDFQAYCDSVVRMKTLPSDDVRVCVQIVDSGNPVPNAQWRQKIAKVSADVPANTLFVMVSGPLARGIATAINWIRPPTYAFRTAATFIDATLLAEEFAGRPLPALRGLHRQARGAVREVA